MENAHCALLYLHIRQQIYISTSSNQTATSSASSSCQIAVLLRQEQGGTLWQNASDADIQKWRSFSCQNSAIVSQLSKSSAGQQSRR